MALAYASSVKHLLNYFPKENLVGDLCTYMSVRGDEKTLGMIHGIDQLHLECRAIDRSLDKKKSKLDQDTPELFSCLGILTLMEKKQQTKGSLKMLVPVNKDVSMYVTVPSSSNLHLYIGANVTVQCTLAEARLIIEKNVMSAVDALKFLEREKVRTAETLSIIRRKRVCAMNDDPGEDKGRQSAPVSPTASELQVQSQTEPSDRDVFREEK